MDRGSESVHFQDLVALSPDSGALEGAMGWVLTQDAAETFPLLVREVVDHVRRASGSSR